MSYCLGFFYLLCHTDKHCALLNFHVVPEANKAELFGHLPFSNDTELKPDSSIHHIQIESLRNEYVDFLFCYHYHHSPHLMPSYCPMSNISFLRKLEKVTKTQFRAT